MQSKPLEAHQSHAPIQRGSRVRQKHQEPLPGGDRGTVIRLGTEANGRTGFAWVKFDRRAGQWVDLTHLEAVEMPGSSAEQPLSGATPQAKQPKT